jgi:hypothetical protein
MSVRDCRVYLEQRQVLALPPRRFSAPPANLLLVRLFCLWDAGPAAIADSHSKVVPEEADRQCAANDPAGAVLRYE